MIQVDVDLGERRYPILIGTQLLAHSGHYLPHLAGRQVLIVTNSTVAPLFAAKVEQALHSCDVSRLELPDGEQYKTLDTLSLIFDRLIGLRFSRGATLLALGGGVVGDITGFAAACYQRGVSYLQVPTTLLAQVDSSVGGKTAVNHPRGKNMIGAFHQPRCVIADMDTLRTLPEREFRAGLAEVIKYGVVRDAAFLTWLDANMDTLLRHDAAALAYAVQRSCQIKAAVVAADEKETGDVRAILNYGHTFGHAIEALQGYGSWLHGEAVAAGMVMAADLSWRIGNITREQALRIKTIVSRAGLPTAPPTLQKQDMLDAMSIDKKVQHGQIRFVLAQTIGHAVVCDAVAAKQLNQTLEAGEALCLN